ncbi:unnamed protein product, partial [Symbiodinium necroappetens]
VLRSLAAGGTSWSLLRQLREEQMEADVVHFSCMISSDWCQALWLLAAAAATDISPNAIFKTRVVKVCAPADWLSALQLLGESVRRDTILMNCAMTAFEPHGLWGLALSHLQARAAMSLMPDAVAINTAISSCPRGVWSIALHLLGGSIGDIVAISSTIAAAEWVLAMRLLSKMRPDALLPNVVCFNATLKATDASGLGAPWQRAAQLLSSMPDVAVLPDVISFTSLLRACEREGRWRLALSLLLAMRQVAVLPTTVTCGCLLNACEFAGAWQTAFLLLEEMISASLQLNIVICNTLISTCEKACQWQSALALLFNAGQFQVQPDVIGMNASLGACGCAGAWASSLDLLRRIEGPARTSVSFAGSVAACAAARQWAWAVRLLLATMENALAPDVNSFGTAVEACSALGRDFWPVAFLDELQFMAALQLSASRCPEAFGSSSGLEFGASLGDHTVERFGQGSALGCRSASFAGDARLHGPPKVETNVFHFSSAVAACEKGKAWHLAVDIFQSMSQVGILPNEVTYNSAIGACEGWSWATAIHLLDGMHRVLSCSKTSCDICMSACSRVWHVAVRFLRSMAEYGVLPNVISRSCAVHAGSPWHVAFHLLGQTASDPIAFSAALAARGPWVCALELFENLRFLRLRIDAVLCHHVATACRETGSRVGSWQHAVHICHSMSDIALLQNVVSYN